MLARDFVLQRKSNRFLMRNALIGLQDVSCWKNKSFIYTFSSPRIFPPSLFLLSFHTFNLTHCHRISLILVSIFISSSLHLSARVSHSEFTQALMWLFHHFSIKFSSQCLRSPPSPPRHACHPHFPLSHSNDTNFFYPQAILCVFPVVGANSEMRSDWGGRT